MMNKQWSRTSEIQIYHDLQKDFLLGNWEVLIKTHLSFNLLNHPELSTPTPAVQSLFLLRWCYWSLCEDCSPTALYHLSNPSFFFIIVISDLSQFTTMPLFFIPSTLIAVNDIKECLFYNSVLQTVERDDSKPTPGCKAIKTRIEGILQCLQFVVNSYPQSLKHPGCRLYPTLPPSCSN